MSNLIDHAKREFKKLGYNPIEECEDGPNKWIQENVIELLEVFSNQGHSGSSAPYTIDMFKKLANFDPIAPILCTDDEWNDVGGFLSKEVYQNNRCSAVFKDGKNGKPHYNNAIVWRGQFPDHIGTDKWHDTFTGRVEEYTSSQTIKLPFTPKTFYIDVIREQLPDDWNTEPYIEGSDWYDTEEYEKTGIKNWHKDNYRYHIKDKKQLKEVWKYYERQETPSYIRLLKLKKISEYGNI